MSLYRWLKRVLTGDEPLLRLQELHGVGQKKAQLMFDSLFLPGLPDKESLLSIKGISAKMIDHWEAQEYEDAPEVREKIADAAACNAVVSNRAQSAMDRADVMGSLQSLQVTHCDGVGLEPCYRVVEVGPGMVSFEDSSRYARETGLSVLKKVGLCGNEDVLNLEADKDLFSSMAVATGMLPVATSSGAVLIAIQGKTAALLDSAFNDMSETVAYGTSVLNAAVVAPINPNGASSPIKGFDESGRPIMPLVFDAKSTGIIVGTDGGGLNSLGVLGQFRSIGKGFFAKGLTVPALITVKDGELYTPNSVVLTEEELGLSFADQTALRARRWQDEFKADTSLPRLMAFESGQIKGRYKSTMKKKLEASASGWFEISQEIFGWLIIEAPEKSSTSLNFQPQSLLINSELAGVTTSEQLAKCHLLWLDEQSHHPESDKIDQLLSQVLGKKVKANYPGAMIRSPKAEMWRRCSNGNTTIQPTRRLMMVSNKGREFTGLAVVDHRMVKRGAVAACGWRGPLLVPQALAAPVLVSTKLCLSLVDWINQGMGESKLDKSYDLIKSRLEFKQGKPFTKQQVRDVLVGIIEVTSLMPITKHLVLLDCEDVKDCQGDDDGDTYVIDTRAALVKQFEATERWWLDFFARNNLKKPEIEQSKDLRVQYARSVGTYLKLAKGEALSDEAMEKLIEDCRTFGVYAPEICEALGLTQTASRIPSPKGFTFADLNELDKLLDGQLWTDREMLQSIVGSTAADPRGPVGPPSNICADIMMDMLSELDEDGLLSPRGRELWQGYRVMAYCVQTSIDFAKRAYNILNLALWNKQNDGEYSISFDKELTPESTNGLTVSESFNQFSLARVLVEDEYVHVLVIPGDEELNANSFFNVSGSRTLRGTVCIKDEELKVLRSEGKLGIDEFNLVDQGNGCFGFESIYAIASHILNRADTCVWKKDPSSWPETYAEILWDLRSKGQTSSFVFNATHFLDFMIGSDEAKELLFYPEKICAAIQEVESPLDDLWLTAQAGIAKFFATGSRKFGAPTPTKQELVRGVYAAFGIETEVDRQTLKHGGCIMVDNREITLVGILRVLVKNDTSWMSSKVPQCSWQIVFDDFIQPEESSELETRVEAYVQASLKRCLEMARSIPAPTERNPKRTVSMISSPEWAIRQMPELEAIWSGLLETTEYGNKTWISSSAMVKGIELWIYKHRRDAARRLANNPETLKLIFDFLKTEESVAKGCRKIRALFKSTFASFDKPIRELRVWQDSKQEEICSFWYRGSADDRWKRFDEESEVDGFTIPDVANPVNLFAAHLEPRTWIRGLLETGTLAPSQYSRHLQFQVVKKLVAGGYMVKSWSFFANSGFKDYTTVALMLMIAQGRAIITHGEVRPIQASCSFDALRNAARQISQLNKWSGRLIKANDQLLNRLHEYRGPLKQMLVKKQVGNKTLVYLGRGVMKASSVQEAFIALNSRQSHEYGTWKKVNELSQAVNAYLTNDQESTVWLDGRKYELASDEAREKFKAACCQLLSYFF